MGVCYGCAKQIFNEIWVIHCRSALWLVQLNSSLKSYHCICYMGLGFRVTPFQIKYYCHFRLFIPCIFCMYCNKVTNGCNSLFGVFISFFTLHVSGSHKPIIRGISSCFLYTAIWLMQCLCCSSACACGLVCRGGFTVQ